MTVNAPRADARPSYPQVHREEWIADAVVHAIGLTLALIGGGWLIVYAQSHGDLRLTAGLTVYVAGLLAMLVCSTLYNVNTDRRLRAIFERLDLSAIYVMIAGTYTPFMLTKFDGLWAIAFLGVLWTAAFAGVALKLLTRLDAPKVFIALYLTLGWLGILVLKPLIGAVSPVGLGFLAVGGVLYSVGVIFHVWEKLQFNSAIWHCFVIAAAACHFAAVFHEVAVLA